ncbi:caspase-14-like isoform X2 [Dreissena polymorpha]|uniref:caspase-14-like isoform X2 n=1 Tax=Dreissena polymorpha TaxID=45954 RepID=UPI002263DDDE|nr:caspase-14-like isoform X2 [Dreissena polymorpha]
MDQIEGRDEETAKVTATGTLNKCDNQQETEFETRIYRTEDMDEQTPKITETGTSKECDKQPETETETSPLTCAGESSFGPRDFEKTVFIHPAILSKGFGESIDAAYPCDGTGFVLLINYSHNRPGSEKDVNKLTGFFRDELGYELEVAQDNMTRHQLRNCLENARTKIDTRFYCFICIVMAHGDETGIMTSDDKVQPYNEILETFDNKSMQNFAGRPKLFFINACRGNRLQTSVPLVNLDHTEADAKPFTPPKLVAETADIFAVYSTVSGFASIRDTEEGSVFIQSCVDVFKKYYDRKTVIEMTTAIQRKVQDRESCQVSEVKTTLTKQLYLKNVKWSSLDQFAQLELKEI